MVDRQSAKCQAQNIHMSLVSSNSSQQYVWYGWEDVIASSSFCHGIQKPEPYDPTVLYQDWEDDRDSDLPPHLVFANLNGILQIPDMENLKKFLATYGPPCLPEVVAPHVYTLEAVTDSALRCQPGATAPNPPERLRTEVRGFWREQQRFRALYLLWMGFRGNKEWADLADCLSRIGTDKVAAHEAILPTIAGTINRRIGTPALSLMGNALQCSWSWVTLLEAMYTMFYWDIERDRPVHECANDRCGRIFAETKSNVRYCSAECERSTRLRKWWFKNGRQYRERKKAMNVAC